MWKGQQGKSTTAQGGTDDCDLVDVELDTEQAADESDCSI
jgi:hypothetical protein